MDSHQPSGIIPMYRAASSYPTNLVKEYPRYRVLERAKDEQGRIHIDTNDILMDRKSMLHTYYAGSVVRYAQECNEDPIAAIERARRLGHNLHWINAKGASITAWKQEQEDAILIGPGDRVFFEGIEFEVVKAPNNNFNLKAI